MKKTTIIFLSVVSLSLLAIPLLRPAWEINLWSLKYLRSNLNHPNASYSLPPDGHARAAVWEARQALAEGDVRRAQGLVDSLIADGDPFGIDLHAYILMAGGDWQGAFQSWSQTGDMVSLMREAESATLMGKLDVALIAYQLAYESAPETYALQLADFLADQMNDAEACEAVLRQALAAHPMSRFRGTWYRRLGDVLKDGKRWGEAADAYRLALEVEPGNYLALIGLGWAQYERGDGLEAAMGQFQRAIEIDPSRGDGYYAIGQVMAREQRFGEADAWFRQAIDLNPNARWWYLERANAARDCGNISLALDLYQEAVIRFPDFSHAYHEMAWAYYLAGRPEDAVYAIEQALETMSAPNQWHYLRAGEIFEWVGMRVEALDAYRNALLINPVNAAANEAINRLKR